MAKASEFTFAPAQRDSVSLIIAIAGGTGAGKTRSALRIARGLAGGDDTKIKFIDTEAGRAKHYAVRPGEAQNAQRYAFQHGDLAEPFSPDHYMAAIDAADTPDTKVIVVDSCSHEWEGEGGLHDMHDDAVAKAVDTARRNHNQNWGPFDEGKAAERAGVGAWKEPKRLHKKFVNRLLQCRAHIILCLRAEEKLLIEQITDERGRKKTVITQAKDLPPNQRWTPICEKRFMFEMTVSLIVSPDKPGVPVPVKIQEQHLPAFPLDQQISERTGEMLAAWASGEDIANHGYRGKTAGEMVREKKTEKKPEKISEPNPEPKSQGQVGESVGQVTDQPATASASPQSPAPPAAETWQDYVSWWSDTMIEPGMTAEKLHKMWVDGKARRNKIAWPMADEPGGDAFDKLKAKLQDRINKLKEA